MKRATSALVLAFVLLPALAFAAETAPETVAQATSQGTKVTWAWGAIVSQGAATIASLAVAGIAILARQLPAQFAAIFANSRVQLLVENSVNYGVNAVAAAVKDQKLSVNVGNQVLAEALQYAVDNAPSYLLSWAGGKDGLAKKIWAKLNLEDGADASALPEVVASTTAAS